ncbi:L(+)-tartrate dehydratase subunit alpha [Anaerosinus massiliensis]|uniref:L(+)-tartrate dehydratase subunit alpha n=1 Tax=Massilibacillus massiliensis TaxID=1806837 RepID=UPI000AC00881|nr:L(+)-tartrate dehydratase subunit alpha [Massilibacillus massiliensis]
MEKLRQYQELTDLLAKFTAYTGKHLPDDILNRLKELRKDENSDLAKVVYDSMFEDLELAEKLDRPCCQDTGVIQFFVEVGTKFPLIDELKDALREAVEKATKLAPLRPNAVEVFDEKNTGNNVGTRIPWIDWEIIPNRDDIKVYAYMAGGGCSLPGTAKVLMPLEGYEGAIKFVFDQITSYGINACPPLLVGIGIAGSVEVAAKLSKKALLRPAGSKNSNARGAMLEEMIEKGLNEIKLGPGGLSGENSVMGVNIEQAARHPATIAVALSTGCWAHRRSSIRIHADLSYEMLSHKGVQL